MWWFSSFYSASVPAAHDTSKACTRKMWALLNNQFVWPGAVFSTVKTQHWKKTTKNTVPEGCGVLRDLSNLKLQWRQNEYSRTWISPLASSKHIYLIGWVRKWWQGIKLCQRVLTSLCFCCCCQRRQIRLVLPSCCKSSGVRAAKQKKNKEKQPQARRVVSTGSLDNEIKLIRLALWERSVTKMLWGAGRLSWLTWKVRSAGLVSVCYSLWCCGEVSRGGLATI